MSNASILLVLAVPSTSDLLLELASGPRSLAEIGQGRGPIPETTLRGYLRTLAAAGAVEKRRHGGFPGSVDYRLTDAGGELRGVAEVLAAWLASAPQSQAPVGSEAAKRAVRVLIESWRTGIVQALARSPLSLTNLAGRVEGLSYPAVERRLSAMRRLGLVQALPGSGRSKPLAASDWLRRAIVPLAAACRWQGSWQAGSTGVARRDVEAMFLLALPVQPLPDALSGSCRLALRPDAGGQEADLASVAVELTGGVAVSRTTEATTSSSAALEGSPSAWISALVEGDPGLLESSGEGRLATALLDQILRELRPQ